MSRKASSITQGKKYAKKLKGIVLRPIPSELGAHPKWFAGSNGRIAREVRTGTWRWLRGFERHGYFYVSYKNKNVRVNRLICAAFHGLPPFPNADAAHWDGDKANNVPDNLRWATRKENFQDSIRLGQNARGSRHGRAKLSEEDVEKVRDLYASGRYRQKHIAEMFKVSPATIGLALKRKTWRHVA